MASIDKFIRGMVGNVVFYERNGKQIMRARANRVKRSPASKARSKNFGHASRLSANFIDEYVRILSLPKFPSLQQRFAGAISRWLGTQPIGEKSAEQAVPWVKGFRLNTATEFHQLFKPPIQLSGNPGEPLLLSIPAFHPGAMIAAPPYIASIVCSIAVVSCSTRDQQMQQYSNKTLEIPFNNELFPAQQIDLDIKLNPGELTVVVASLLYKGQLYNTLNGVQELRWRPTEVIEAIYTQ